MSSASQRHVEARTRPEIVSLAEQCSHNLRLFQKEKERAVTSALKSKCNTLGYAVATYAELCALQVHPELKSGVSTDALLMPTPTVCALETFWPQT